MIWSFLSTDGSDREKASFPEETESLEDSAGPKASEEERSDPSDVGLQDLEDEPLVIHVAFDIVNSVALATF